MEPRYLARPWGSTDRAVIRLNLQTAPELRGKAINTSRDYEPQR